MKTKLFISFGWVVSVLIVFSWMLYAANDYDSSMLAAVTGQRGVQPSYDRFMALEAQRLNAKTLEEVSHIMDMIGEEAVRMGNVTNASVSRRQMNERAWILFGLSTSVPLAFLWWPRNPKDRRILKSA